MSLKKTIPFGMALLFFFMATFASWYEGSSLVDDYFEWKHTAIFTSWMNNGEVQRETISQLDYFVYSIKFKPIFPIIMLVSVVYMLIALGQRFIKEKFINLFIFTVGISLMIGATFLMNSPTAGARAFMFSQLFLGSLVIGYSILRFKRIISIE